MAYREHYVAMTGQMLHQRRALLCERPHPVTEDEDGVRGLCRRQRDIVVRVRLDAAQVARKRRKKISLSTVELSPEGPHTRLGLSFFDHARIPSLEVELSLFI